MCLTDGFSGTYLEMENTRDTSGVIRHMVSIEWSPKVV